MPHRFAFRGERLAFSTGIVALAVLSIAVLAAFGGRVEALIPLYAVGVFTSITLSQAGMVRHWWRRREPGWRRSMTINGVGAVATGIVDPDLRDREVRAGCLARSSSSSRSWSRRWSRSTADTRAVGSRRSVRAELVVRPPRPAQRVIVPVADVSRDVVHALTFARTMSDDVTAVHVTEDAERGKELRARFQTTDPRRPARRRRVAVSRAGQPLVRYLEDAATFGRRRRS